MPPFFGVLEVAEPDVRHAIDAGHEKTHHNIKSGGFMMGKA